MVGGIHLLCFFFFLHSSSVQSPHSRKRINLSIWILTRGILHQLLLRRKTKSQRKTMRMEMGRRNSWVSSAMSCCHLWTWIITDRPLLQFFGGQITKKITNDYTWKLHSAPGGMFLQSSAVCVHLREYWFMSVNRWGSSLLFCRGYNVKKSFEMKDFANCKGTL